MKVWQILMALKKNYFKVYCLLSIMILIKNVNNYVKTFPVFIQL